MYLKDFEIRWSDVDANRHLANSAYINFMSHTRMAYLLQLGFDHRTMATHEIGPVVFYEHVYYFKEAFPGKPIKVSLEIMGMSEDAKFFEFHHNLDLKARKLTGLTNELLVAFSSVEKAEGFRVLTKEDSRKFARLPKNL